MPSAHAKLSPSASSRWLRCPGSVNLTADINREGGSAAQRGTQIHQIGEELLNGSKIEVGQSVVIPNWEDGSKPGELFYASTDMLNEAQDYYDYTMRLVHRDVESELIVEMKVDLTDIAADTFGHADAVVIENKNLHVIDLKTGMGIVSAAENSQLMLYAYGVYKELDMFHDFDMITLHIVQNNERIGGDKSSNWDITPDDLVSWIETEVKPKAAEALSDNATCVPGDIQCKYCDAASFCPTLHAEVSGIVNDIFEDLDPKDVKQAGDKVTIEQVVEFLSKSKLITALLKSYEDRVYHELMAGNDVEGFKLVKGSKHKKWIDEIVAYDKLKTWTKLDDIAPRKLVTPTQAEKILGKLGTQKQKIFGNLWERPEGAETVVPSNDKRPAIKPVIDTFEDLDEL